MDWGGPNYPTLLQDHSWDQCRSDEFSGSGGDLILFLWCSCSGSKFKCDRCLWNHFFISVFWWKSKHFSGSGTILATELWVCLCQKMRQNASFLHQDLKHFSGETPPRRGVFGAAWTPSASRHLNCPPHFLGLATALMFTYLKHYMCVVYIVNLNIVWTHTLLSTVYRYNIWVFSSPIPFEHSDPIAMSRFYFVDYVLFLASYQDLIPIKNCESKERYSLCIALGQGRHS